MTYHEDASEEASTYRILAKLNVFSVIPMIVWQ
jgi:hypothetical protein